MIQHAVHGFLHKLLSILATRQGNVLKPRFDIGRKMYFHVPRLG